MIDGLACSGCGIYFEQEHGHPVLCKDCKKGDPENETPQATEAEL